MGIKDPTICADRGQVSTLAFGSPPTSNLASAFAPAAADCSPRSGRRLAFAVLALASALIYASMKGGFEDALIVGVPLICTVMVAGRALTIRADRVTWAWIAGALALWTAAGAVQVANPGGDGLPQVAEALYLAFYPLIGLALARVVRADADRFAGTMWLDGLIGSLTLATVGAALAFQAALDAQGAEAAAGVATQYAHALGDVVLLAIVGGMLALTGWRPGRAWAMLMGGVALVAIADSALLRDTTVLGTGPSVVSATAVVLLAAAAWQQPARHRQRPAGWTMLGVPVLSTLLAVALLIVLGQASTMNTLGIVLAALTVAAAMVRLGMTFREVTAFAQTQYEAVTDELTKLGNRRLFYRRMEELLKNRAPEEAYAVFLIDLDRFKELNDTLGHHAGDLLLQQVGPRLEGTLRPDDVLARLGGDEFGAIVAIEHAKEAAAIAERMQSALEDPFAIQGLSLRVQASVGIALCPAQGTTADQLVRRADVAMYQAKAGHNAYEFYSSDRDAHTRDRLELVTQLREAIDTDQLVLWYQPQADLATGRVTSVEALVRWNHPQRGILMPDEFVGIAEQTGLIDALTVRVLDMALEQCDAWRRANLNLSVAVNLTAHHMLDSSLPTTVSGLLEKWRLPAHRLALEVTENSAMSDPERAVRVIAKLRQLGVATSIDDYGTGYSSLAYLRRLRVDELKIDRSFVSGLSNSPESELIVRSTIDLARNLGLRVIAEGVETPAEWALLCEMGCDSVQGYLLGRPMPGDEVVEWVANWRQRHPHMDVTRDERPALRVVA